MSDSQSLPSRERELKLTCLLPAQCLKKSLPSRERELKQFFAVTLYASLMSLPSRERELKPLFDYLYKTHYPVAPFAGARVETLAVSSAAVLFSSLPSRERELKRLETETRARRSTSLPSRERELKLVEAALIDLMPNVAPFAGARVETEQDKQAI